MIDIQAPNQLEILTCIRETFEYMPGWQVMSSVHQSSTDSRFFCFNLTEHSFEWWRTNDTFSDTMDEDEVIIKDIADISYLLEFVWVNGEQLRVKGVDLKAAFEEFFGSNWKKPEPKKRKKADEPTAHHINITNLENKLKEFESKPEFNPIMFIEGIPYPDANVFYKDLSAQVAKAKECPSPEMLWYAKEEAWYANQQQEQQNNKKMAAEIDKEVMAKIIIEYEKYTEQTQKEETQKAYDKAACGVWDHGWDYSPIPGAKGLMVKTLSPYPFAKFDNNSNSMDY